MANTFTSRWRGSMRTSRHAGGRSNRHGGGGRYSGAAARRAAFDRIDMLSQLLDNAFVLPGTNIRFGLDGIIGLVPGIGDTITTLIALYIVAEARALGAPRTLIVRMIGNVVIDGAVGAVPLIGDAFDVAFRANRRNIALLKDYLMRDGTL